jgi:hypothetical protein
MSAAALRSPARTVSTGFLAFFVSIHRGSDNIGSFQRRAFEELTRCRASGRPFRCYVDPQNPANAVLYRQARWEMIAFYAMFALVFGGAGVGLLAVWALRLVRRRLRYGTSLFRMARLPGVIGGALRGTVEIPARVDAADGYRLALRCVNQITTSTSDGTSTRETVLWEDVRTRAQPVQDGNPDHVLIPVSFTVPRDCRPTDATASSDQIVWRLEVRADVVSGPLYASRFEVPVFVTVDSVAEVRPDDGAPDRYGRRVTPEDAAREDGVRVEPLAEGGTRYAAVEVSESSQQGNRAFYRLKLRTVDGRLHTAGHGIVGRTVADALAAGLRQRLGLADTGPAGRLHG